MPRSALTGSLPHRVIPRICGGPRECRAPAFTSPTTVILRRANSVDDAVATDPGDPFECLTRRRGGAEGARVLVITDGDLPAFDYPHRVIPRECGGPR